jgi:hypothetical protein
VNVPFVVNVLRFFTLQVKRLGDEYLRDRTAVVLTSDSLDNESSTLLSRPDTWMMFCLSLCAA